MSGILGISRSKLNAHENGQTTNPPADDLLNFSAFFKLSVDTLLKVDLTRLSETKLQDLEAGNDNYATGSKLRVIATTVDPSNRDNIEFVPHKARAGYLSGFSDPEFVANLPVFTMPHLPRDQKFRMFPTTGDSMYPIPENAFVIGRFIEDWNTIKDGTPAIVITRQDGIVFKLVDNQLKKKRGFLLQSLNTAYAPYEVEAGDILEIWQFVNYVSDTIPEPEADMNLLSRSISEIKADLKKLIQHK